MRIEVPQPSLVVLVGAAGCGKSTFAHAHFRPTAILSSDAFRAMLCDNASDQSVTREAFELLHAVAEKRLRRGLATVIDATSVQQASRASLLALARRCSVPAIAIVFDYPEALCVERDRMRSERRVGEAVVMAHHRELTAALATIAGEGFDAVHIINDPMAAVECSYQRKNL